MRRLLICLIIKELNSIVTDLFIRGRKRRISIVSITQSYFAVTKNIRPNSTHSKLQTNESISNLHLITESLQKIYCKAIFVFSD